MATTIPPWMGKQPSVPDPRSLSGEMSQLTPYLGQLAGMSNDMFLGNTTELAKMQRQQTQWQSQFNYDWQMQHAQGLAEEDIRNQQMAAAAQRYDTLGYMANWGPQWDEAYKQANPSYGNAMGQLDNMVNQIGAGLSPSNFSSSLDTLAAQRFETGPVSSFTAPLDELAASQLSTGPTTPFTGELDQQILGELKLGGAMTPEEERMVQQSSREAFAARGMAMSDPAALSEVLNRDSYSQARLRERQGLAGGREQLGIQRQLLGQAFGQQREASEIQRMQIGQQFAQQREAVAMAQKQADRQFMLGATQLSAQTSPVNMALGMQGYGVAPVGSMLGYTQPAQIQQSQDIFAPMGTAGLQYGTDLFSGNMSMQADLYNNWMNNMAQIEAANVQAAGTLAGAKSASGGAAAGSAIGAVGAVAGSVIAAF